MVGGGYGCNGSGGGGYGCKSVTLVFGTMEQKPNVKVLPNSGVYSCKTVTLVFRTMEQKPNVKVLPNSGAAPVFHHHSNKCKSSARSM